MLNFNVNRGSLLCPLGEGRGEPANGWGLIKLPCPGERVLTFETRLGHVFDKADHDFLTTDYMV